MYGDNSNVIIAASVTLAALDDAGQHNKGFGNHTTSLSHLIPLHGVRSKQDLCGIFLNIALLPQDYQFCVCISSFLSYSLLNFWSGVKSKMEESESLWKVHTPRANQRPDTTHVRVLTVQSIGTNQRLNTVHRWLSFMDFITFSECIWTTYHSSWLIGTWTYHSINRASIGIPPIW